MSYANLKYQYGRRVCAWRHWGKECPICVYSVCLMHKHSHLGKGLSHLRIYSHKRCVCVCVHSAQTQRSRTRIVPSAYIQIGCARARATRAQTQ